MRLRNRCIASAFFFVKLTVFAGMLSPGHLRAAEPGPSVSSDAKVDAATLVERAVAYLRNEGVAADGSFSASAGPAVTALVATGLMQNHRSPSDPLVARALSYLEEFVQSDGGVYSENSTHRNYETCIAVAAFQLANDDGSYDKVLKDAERFLRGLQWDAGEGIESSDTSYGGAGYGSHKRPDLSNTQFLIEALRSLGSGEDDPAIQRALIFVSRCQNLETEHNTTPFSAKNPDGGFYYTPAAGGTSQAGQTANGGLRSYGSMTYAGLKSMIYAGVGPEDPRVQAALAWIQRNYELDSNPGMGSAGLYYYYHTFSKALDATGESEVVDDDGSSHNWRRELVDALATLQRENGSWINDNERWLEGDPNLVTAYALLALSYCDEEAE